MFGFTGKKITFGLFLAFFIWAEAYGGGTYLQVNNSHNGRVTRIVYDKNSGLLFSAGDDGTVRVWDLENFALLKSIRISYLPVKMLAVDSNNSRIGVISSNEISMFELSVWDWKTGQMLFSRTLKSMPLYIGFSSRGSYFVYTLPSWKSVNILDPSTGERLDYFNKAFGIVSFLTFSTSENNILTYQPSGVLTYWDFRTGSEIKRLFTAGNLSKICISNNKRFLVAKKSDKLMMIDLLSGNVLDSTEVKNIETISISPGDNEVACISSDGDETKRLERFMIFNGGFLKLGVEEENGISSLQYGNNGLFKGYDSGTISENLPGGITKIVAEDKISNVSDFFVDKNALVLATSGEIYEIKSNYFNEDFNPRLSHVSVTFRRFVNPLNCASGICRLDDKRIVVWGKNSENEGFSVLNLETGDIEFVNNNFDSSLVYVGVSKDWIITIEDSGKCSLYDVKSFDEKYSYFIPGMHKLIPINRSNMVGAKSKLGNFDSSLTLLNVETGENFPITDKSLYVYELAFNEKSELLYSIGIEKENSELYTVLKSHFGNDFSNQYVLDKFEGEDIGASLSMDEKNSILYSSLGYTGIRGYVGGRSFRFGKSDKVARKIEFCRGKIYSLNRDRSFTIWDTNKKKPLFDFYLFKDGEWLGVLQESSEVPGGFYSSSGGEKYINVVRNGCLLNSYYKELYKLHFNLEDIRNEP